MFYRLQQLEIIAAIARTDKRCLSKYKRIMRLETVILTLFQELITKMQQETTLLKQSKNV